MTKKEQFQQRIDLQIERITDYLDSLSLRERIMVIFTTIFVMVAAIGAALFYMNKAANFQQKRVNELKDTVVWMQSNAVQMKAASDTQMSALEKVQRVAQQQGLSVDRKSVV